MSPVKAFREDSGLERRRRGIVAMVVAAVAAALLPGSGRASLGSLHAQVNNSEHESQALDKVVLFSANSPSSCRTKQRVWLFPAHHCCFGSAHPVRKGRRQIRALKFNIQRNFPSDLTILSCDINFIATPSPAQGQGLQSLGIRGQSYPEQLLPAQPETACAQPHHGYHK